MPDLIDLTGQTFGRLTVLGRVATNTKLGKPRWACRCACGTETVVDGSSLRSGNTKTCGCSWREATHRLIDLTGQTFGRLTALSRGDNIGPRAAWLCRCSCGRSTTVLTALLRNGNTRSCGCLNKDNPGRPKEPMVAYIGAHTRVHRERGKAKYFACVDCGGPARDWSYDHTDPDEVTGQHVTGSGRTTTATYSLKPEHYSPRCKSCHSKFDQKPVLEGATK